MDTAKAPSVIESSGQHLRREDMPPVSQVSEVKNPVEDPSSVPAEGNTGNEAKKSFFKRIWSKAKGRLCRKNPKNEERHLFLHSVRQLPPAHQRGPSDPSGFVNLGRQDPRACDPKVVKYPDSGPARCVMCNGQLHDSTRDSDSWKRCETRVYLPCGHQFGHRCLHSYLTERLRSRTPESDAIIVGGEHYCPMGGCIPIRHECDHLAIPTLKVPKPRINRLLDDKWLSFHKQHFQACEARRYTWLNIVIESPTNMDPEEVNALRRSIGAPEIAIHPGQQEQSDLPTGPSPEMRENRSQTKTIKQKTAEISSTVGNAVDPDPITPAEARTSWKLPEVAKQPPFEVPTPGATGSSAVGAASTNGTVGSKNRTNPTATNGTAPRLPVHKAASQPELGSIDKKTNVGPGGDVTEKEPQIVVTLPDTPKDDPKKSAKETESKAKGKRKVAQPIAS
ncbi:ring finger domain containing protein [Fusarium agapanthi]|uniref:Ring finger domain containing protein n=1 Tax=Fusarium agapanthi TaxID=1803897 RepID=A0A9P5AZJ2_9HYPO|nr:ring finger domain containing protein [Fusarium agapanthi]